MNKSKAISKIERILNRIKSSSFDESHVEHLFVTARYLPKATERIFEIGSFVAHGVERNQGLINDIMLRNHLYISMTFGKDKELIDNAKNRFPKYLPELIKLQLRLFNDEELKQALNLKGGQVQRARATLNKKNAFVIDGEHCIPSEKIGSHEVSVINHIMTRLSTNDGIEYNSLIEELIALLKDDIDINLINCLHEKKREICCYLLLLLNNVIFSIHKKIKAKTIIFIEGNIIQICGSYPIINEDDETVTILNSVFNSNYIYSEIFEEDVTAEDFRDNNLEFSHITKKLSKIKNIV